MCQAKLTVLHRAIAGAGAQHCIVLQLSCLAQGCCLIICCQLKGDGLLLLLIPTVTPHRYEGSSLSLPLLQLKLQLQSSCRDAAHSLFHVAECDQLCITAHMIRSFWYHKVIRMHYVYQVSWKSVYNFIILLTDKPTYTDENITLL